MTSNELKALQAHLGLSESAFCAYLGTPVGTLRKWLAGTRKPDASTRRLFAVLQMVETMAPDLHDNLISEARAPVAQDQTLPADRTPAIPDMPDCLKTPQKPVPAIPDWLRIAI
jgi:transcriptional regulator with XRE-family HTH domain